MNLVLTSERLLLTPLSETDIDIALEMYTDPAVVKYVCDPMSEDEIRKEMSYVTKRGSNGCIGIWCISDRRTSEKYGDGYLLPMPVDEDDTDWDLLVPDAMPDGDIEVGYFLKRSAWGNGFATEACRRLIKFAFEETSLKEVVATLDEGNQNSRIVLEKAGFSYGGRIRAYGKDGPHFRISREEWTELNQSGDES